MPSANSRMHHKARHRGLSLMIVGEHETAQLRPEMAIEALWQRRRYDGAGQGQPALALKVNDMRVQHQLLNHKAGVATAGPSAARSVIIVFRRWLHSSRMSQHIPEDAKTDEGKAIA